MSFYSQVASDVAAPTTPSTRCTDRQAEAGPGGRAVDRRSAEVVPGRMDPARWTRVHVASDIAALATSTVIALEVTDSRPTTRWLAVFFSFAVVIMLHRRRGPDRRLDRSLAGIAAVVAGATGRASVLSLALCALVRLPHGPATLLHLSVSATACVTLARATLVVNRRRRRTSTWTCPTIIVGAGTVGGYLARRLLDEQRYGLHPVGYIDPDPVPSAARAASGLPLLGDLDNLGEAVERTGARRVILAFSSTPDHALVEIVRECERRGIDISVVPRLYESINEYSALDRVGGLPLFTLRPTDPHGWQFTVKHALDRSVAAIALLVLAPLIVAIAIAVRLSSPGPVLFRQRRVGRDGHEFTLLKFRTMTDRAERLDCFAPLPGLAPGGIEGEDRRTAIGRLLRELSLDELPQLINVVRGDMSLVGPRPERPEFVERFTAEITQYQDRHRVKSGITGWAQVHGLRGQTSILERVERDNDYIQNWSLRLDVKIIFLTIVELLRRRG